MAGYRYGGQALMEGVLMRGRDAIAVALRHPDGQIVWATEPLAGSFRTTRSAKMPLLRGLVVLYETLVVGTRWLVRSASVAASETGAEFGRGSIALMLLLTLGFGIGIFFVLPLLLARATAGSIESAFVEHLVEGLFRVAIFIGYLLLISRASDVRRVFQYHGAEHMTIHALEHGDPLTVDAVRRYPTAHPRCGTEFLVVVIIISIFAFGFIGRQDLFVMILSRVLLVPIIAAISYELLRIGARFRHLRLVRWIFAPGIWVQMITTRQPTDDMVEVAIVSMEQALVADGASVPEGSDQPTREPLEDAEARIRARFATPPTIAPAPAPQDDRPAADAAPGE